MDTLFMPLKVFPAFLKFLVAYALIILVLSQQGDAKFEHLHLLLDTGNCILSLTLAAFLFAEQYNIERNVRQYLVAGFSIAAFTEVVHALVGIEWTGPLQFIQTYSSIIRPATWPPSTYVLPLALACLLWMAYRKTALRISLFLAGLIIVMLGLYLLVMVMPIYTDTGILGIQRPMQFPLLLIWMFVIPMCWRVRAEHPLYEGLVWMGVMLFLSDLCMLYSTSPHEKFAMMAHVGKLFAYMLLHIAQMRIASEDSKGRKLAEHDLRIAATAFESHEGIMITDANKIILRVNRAFTNITGYVAEEVLGKNPRILSSGRQDANFYAAMWKSINSTDSWEGEIWNRRKNGEIYPEYLTITAVKDLSGAVTNYVASLIDITLSKEAADEIKNLAFYDPLTHLPNRRLLLDRLKQSLASSARSGQSGALLFIDLDNFKNLNDTLGHDIGDLMLQQVAQRLESCMRESDTVARPGGDEFVARLGGDEFVVMLEDLSEQPIEAAAKAEAVGEKILAIINRPFLLATHHYHSTPSIGATLFNGHHQSIDELMKQADIAMYQAKGSGRNTLRFFDPKMQDSINARTTLESELRKALESQQFQLYYQVQVDSSHRSLGAEALIRWLHPERGLVLPLQFIPLAEQTGLILPIGLWVLETACTQIKIWQQDAITRDLVLAINVSAKQFRQADFVDQVQAAVQRQAINPRLLKLELTEGLLLEDVEETIETMNALNDIGVQLSLDDFGTGYSSLQYLKRLPLNQLKIDQSFIRDLAADSSDKAIVRTIIAMANSMNLDVIAEGVETEEQRQLLLNKGCNHYQGYLFSKPVPIEQFETLMKQS